MTKQSTFAKGRAAEQKVAQDLKSHGAKVNLSPGSRTTTDIEVKWSTGRHWLIQVKSGKSPQWPSADELKGLNSRATKVGATPVVALVEKGKIEYYSARNRKKLRP
ncbi:hypothetical protein DRN85_10140 [Methanosarcinales archaeon]|nr:MAG: hypothetical protein DRN85_10140 [Methanosarcinales archaeon]